MGAAGGDVASSVQLVQLSSDFSLVHAYMRILRREGGKEGGEGERGRAASGKVDRETHMNHIHQISLPHTLTLLVLFDR